jgi:tRNA-dihydrouridine synthase B
MTTTASLPMGPDQPWLAPLAGFSDLPFRLLCREQGCRVACTEMISAKGMLYNNAATNRLLATHPTDTPLVVQVYGPDPECIGRAMDLLLEQGFSWFDLNAGCSVRKVTKTGSGAALLREPDMLLAIAREMGRRAGPGRFGVKLRLGWRPEEAVLPDLGGRLEDAGAGWLTLHPRWASQGFAGRADWDWLARLRLGVALPVLASGDLFTAEDACRCLRQTRVRGVMFARGALWDPAIFHTFMAMQGTGGAVAPEPAHGIGLVRRHMHLARTHLDDQRALLAMRTIAPRYLRRFPGAKALRTQLTTLSSWAELARILDQLDDQEALSRGQ